MYYPLPVEDLNFDPICFELTSDDLEAIQGGTKRGPSPDRPKKFPLRITAIRIFPIRISPAPIDPPSPCGDIPLPLCDRTPYSH